jgi:hypothetical protein
VAKSTPQGAALCGFQQTVQTVLFPPSQALPIGVETGLSRDHDKDDAGTPEALIRAATALDTGDLIDKIV